MLRRIHPAARVGLARVLFLRAPTLTPERAVSNATDIIRALHGIGLEIGPMAAFGPHDQALEEDVFGGLADMMKDFEERQPWLPDSERPPFHVASTPDATPSRTSA